MVSIIVTRLLPVFTSFYFQEGIQLGQKIEEIVHLVKTGIPGGEQALLCQNNDLIEKISNAFDFNEISQSSIPRSLATSSKGASILEEDVDTD